MANIAIPTQSTGLMSIDDIVSEILYEEESSKEYSMWFKQGEDYIPGVNVKTAEHIPSGVYKIAYERDEYHIKPVKVSTDELYKFEESFTDIILNEVQKFWDKKDLYEANHLAHKRGLLLEGAPGCGNKKYLVVFYKKLK